MTTWEQNDENMGIDNGNGRMKTGEQNRQAVVLQQSSRPLTTCVCVSWERSTCLGVHLIEDLRRHPAARAGTTSPCSRKGLSLRVERNKSFLTVAKHAVCFVCTFPSSPSPHPLEYFMPSCPPSTWCSTKGDVQRLCTYAQDTSCHVVYGRIQLTSENETSQHVRTVS